MVPCSYEAAVHVSCQRPAKSVWLGWAPRRQAFLLSRPLGPACRHRPRADLSSEKETDVAYGGDFWSVLPDLPFGSSSPLGRGAPSQNHTPARFAIRIASGGGSPTCPGAHAFAPAVWPASARRALIETQAVFIAPGINGEGPRYVVGVEASNRIRLVSAAMLGVAEGGPTACYASSRCYIERE